MASTVARVTRPPSRSPDRMAGSFPGPATPLGVALGVILAALPAPAAAQTDTLSLDQLRRAGEVDSAYATPGLRAFVGRAAEENARLPELLESYHVPVESEISILQAGSDGREVVLQLEQVASRVLWRRDLPTVQVVDGYRSRTVGLVPSALTLFDVPWVVPTLYGDRIDLVRWNAPATDEEGRVLRRRALHPLGPGRSAVYRFTGGDTVLTLRLPERTIPLVRVEVEPVRFPDRPTLLFEGYMDVDATRHQIVRMRGRMISSDPDPGADERLLGSLFGGATFVSFENAEFTGPDGGRYWLPRYQRIEVQALSRLTDTRIALRTVSRFGFPELNETGELGPRYPDPAPGGLLVLGDAVRRRDFAGWETDLGELTREVNALDFRDLDPGGAAMGTGPHVRFGVPHLSNLLRYNEAEGVFTGVGVVVRPGRAWREGRLRAHGGWAWGEGTVRGGVEVAHAPEGGRWEWLLAGERQIRSTSDFGRLYNRDEGVPPLVAGEGELLYDHRTAGLVARQPRDAGWAWRVQAARAGDRAVPLDLEGVQAPGDAAPPPDPDAGPVREGDYWVGRVTLERSRATSGFDVVPGTGLRLHAEGGTGDLEWLRLEAGTSVRRVWSSFALDGRLDAGAVLAERPPPQRLFELGEYTGLPGYPPRAFAGDRAVLGQLALAYTLPLLRRPLRLGGFYLPALAPAPTVVLRSGWTGASEDAAPILPVLGSTVSDGVRSTLDLRLRLFGGGVSFGMARPLDEGGEWRFVWSLAGEL